MQMAVSDAKAPMHGRRIATSVDNTGRANLVGNGIYEGVRRDMVGSHGFQ
jgi:hypothetical protein